MKIKISLKFLSYLDIKQIFKFHFFDFFPRSLQIKFFSCRQKPVRKSRCIRMSGTMKFVPWRCWRFFKSLQISSISFVCCKQIWSVKRFNFWFVDKLFPNLRFYSNRLQVFKHKNHKSFTWTTPITVSRSCWIAVLSLLHVWWY